MPKTGTKLKKDTQLIYRFHEINLAALAWKFFLSRTRISLAKLALIASAMQIARAQFLAKITNLFAAFIFFRATFPYKLASKRNGRERERWRKKGDRKEPKTAKGRESSFRFQDSCEILDIGMGERVPRILRARARDFVSRSIVSFCDSAASAAEGKIKAWSS